jgi:hypothetical protein
VLPVSVNVGQPISHRPIISFGRAGVALKVFSGRSC